jgi:hypothetical protein
MQIPSVSDLASIIFSFPLSSGFAGACRLSHPKETGAGTGPKNDYLACNLCPLQE